MGKPKKMVCKADAYKQKTLTNFYKKAGSEVNKNVVSGIENDRSNISTVCIIKKILRYVFKRYIYFF